MSIIQQWVVGGSVRDVLLGVEPKDIDYVWTGTTPQHLINLGMSPVGADFPVFLDSNGDQHALARIERKTGVGYNGFECEFDPTITIREDLLRRDLTINSMAVKIEDWETFKQTRDSNLIMDPYNGLTALHCGQLNATSDAFAEDPVRVLRTARFAARYDFYVGESTMVLMNNIKHELNSVSPERIWSEIAKGFMEKYPNRMFEVLCDIDAFSVDILKPFNISNNFHILINCSADIPLECRFSMTIGHNFALNDYKQLTIPNDCSRLNMVYQDVKQLVITYDTISNKDKLELFTRMRAFNNTSMVDSIIKIVTTLKKAGQLTQMNVDIPNMIRTDIAQLKQLNLSKITAGMKYGKQIQQAVMDARLSVLNQHTHK